MRFPHFFIDRPIFAAVLSVLILVFGIVALPTLPVTQYPEIAPPTVVVTAQFPGASAETLAETVAAPLEEAINGVENMIYMSSSSTGDGALQITVTFAQGTDADQAQVLVQNRVASAEPRLPEQTRQIGVTTLKNSPDFLMVAMFSSPDGSLSQEYVSNYVGTQVIDRLARVQGVGNAQAFGSRDYNMRVWIDPDLAAARNLTVDEITTAIRGQNAQVAAGAVGQPPFAGSGSAFQLGVQTEGRLTTPEQFGEIIIKRDANGAMTRLRDVARIELGAETYAVNAYLNGVPVTAVAISQLPGSNALDAADAVIKELEEAKKSFPPGMTYSIPYNPTEYISASIEAVVDTLVEAIILVALVVLVFLQSWRAAIIPIIAIPVSLLGSLAILAGFGYSLNNLSLFGMVLAIGIVVDDAIVVVENVERLMEERGMSPREAAHETMDEVAGALIAIALVLCGVFVPTMFIPGISGQFYQQFALTIVSATAISAIVSLTLSPAMAALILKPKAHDAEPKRGWRGLPGRFARGFNRGFDWLAERYGRFTARAVRMLGVIAIAYVLLIGLAGWRFYATPTGFIPAQDQGYLITAAQLPPGSSLQRTTEVMLRAEKTARQIPGMKDTVMFVGLDGASFSTAPNTAAMFVTMQPHAERADADTLANQLRGALAQFNEGLLLVIPPPPVQGIGTGGGWKMMIEDRENRGYQALEAATFGMMMKANQTPGIAGAFTLFNTRTPRLFADVDRERAEQLGVPVSNIFSTMGTYLGSSYVNDFNLLGRTFRVTAQADAPYRDETSDIGRLRTRSASGAMVPLDAVMTIRDDSGPYRVVRYNLYPSAEFQGDTVPGFSSGQTLAALEKIAAETLPEGMSYEWTELAFQQKQAGNTGVIAFALAVLFVFLLLAANYESLVLPLAVILIVPMCLLAAMLGVNLMGMDNNILTQIGLVVLIGLAAKNAILIVEFAKQNEEEGKELLEAARLAAAQRLRPILMTSIAFILGVLPLVIGTGPGAEMRRALGVAVFFGMIGVTLFGLVFTPAFYVISRKFGDWAGRRLRRKPKATPPAPVAEPGAPA
ncbi:hydrophobe/amphiphile efflux-1 family RND transporter [Sphingomonas spermidinifaciens]|uniref:Efflux pump membrane transporter n=1 Tax=Sphingomonas spermidinifaciens TaxID=1141889 RepID=A0A2A4AX53_9SPHN|nr:multidrug efflux RND transporter permease subunit [Sphingomonas spermidinifaciens]PCD01523.1 hydrophobe/amphiphile efflux-1 family RND transporter [Sphingomonas spermidinifaciens]